MNPHQSPSVDQLIPLYLNNDGYRNDTCFNLTNVWFQEVTKKDCHRLRLARLEWELTQRKVLAETCNELMIEKDKTASEIRKKKDRIENLIPMIKNILSVGIN